MTPRRGLALGCALSTALACSPAEEECFHQSRDVQAEDSVRGHVVGELLERYFGRHEGTLTWLDAGTTSFSLEFAQQPDNPYTLYEVYECDPRLVSHWSSARVVSADGAFDNEVAAVITGRFPYSSLVPASVASFSLLPAEEWTARLPEHLTFDASRYVEGGLQLVLDWSSGDVAPRGGAIDFLGTTASTPPLVDTIRVASLAF